MPSCALLTLADRDGWFIDDDLLHEPLKTLGWEVQDIPWTYDVDWDHFDIVVIRSPWDYQQDPSRFFEVLETIDQSSAVLLNSLKTVRWNVNKSYLFDLEKRGIEIIPTCRFSNVSVEDLREAEKQFGSGNWIMKPIVGANADDTFRIRKGTGDAELKELCGLFKDMDCLVQPFMEQVPIEGEYSCIFFDGEPSHSVVKRARKGDFRVQEEHGGSVRPYPDPEPEMLAAAQKTMSVLDEVPLYARVDLVRTADNRFVLMELELIEPSLYFRFATHSANEFARVIDRRFCSN